MTDLTNLLKLSKATKPSSGIADLRTIKLAASLLPDFAPCDDDATSTLDILSAIIFHISLPMREARAEAWYDAHPIEAKAKVSGSSLLAALGMLKPTEPLRRRV